jgi:hypothetical protein
MPAMGNSCHNGSCPGHYNQRCGECAGSGDGRRSGDKCPNCQGTGRVCDTCGKGPDKYGRWSAT